MAIAEFDYVGMARSKKNAMDPKQWTTAIALELQHLENTHDYIVQHLLEDAYYSRGLRSMQSTLLRASITAVFRSDDTKAENLTGYLTIPVQNNNFTRVKLCPLLYDGTLQSFCLFTNILPVSPRMLLCQTTMNYDTFPISKSEKSYFEFGNEFKDKRKTCRQLVKQDMAKVLSTALLCLSERRAVHFDDLKKVFYGHSTPSTRVFKTHRLTRHQTRDDSVRYEQDDEGLKVFIQLWQRKTGIPLKEVYNA